MNRVNVFAIHRCINEGYGLVRIFTEKIRISPTKLWRVCVEPEAVVESAVGDAEPCRFAARRLIKRFLL